MVLTLESESPLQARSRPRPPETGVAGVEEDLGIRDFLPLLIHALETPA